MKIKGFFILTLKVLIVCVVLVLSFVFASGIAFARHHPYLGLVR